MDFAGGEPTIYPEFEKLLSLFIERKFKDIYVNTSCIKYSPSISEALKQGCINLTISVDAGSEEVHKQVKRVSSFEKVWKNISEYSKAQEFSGKYNQIWLKYLVVPNVNDKESEMDKFIDKVQEYNIRCVALSLDMFWYEQHKNEDNSLLISKFDYFCDIATKAGLSLHVYPWARWSMESKQKV